MDKIFLSSLILLFFNIATCVETKPTINFTANENTEPGKIIITYKQVILSSTMQDTMVVEGRQTQQTNEGDAWDDCYELSFTSCSTHGCPIDEGWNVDTNSIGYQNWKKPEGDWSYAGFNIKPNFVYVSFLTHHHLFGASGKVFFYIVFKEIKKCNEDCKFSHRLDLNWNETRVIQIPTDAVPEITFYKNNGDVINLIEKKEINPIVDVKVKKEKGKQVIILKTIPKPN